MATVRRLRKLWADIYLDLCAFQSYYAYGKESMNKNSKNLYIQGSNNNEPLKSR